MLEARDLHTYYGQYQVLRGVSLDVADGEMVALFGPNGHGKSTLLKTLCGLVHPTQGTILFDGHDIRRLPVQKIVELGLVYVPEERNLFLDMSVMDNLIMGAYTKKAEKKRRENLDRVFDLFPRLKERQRQYVRNLSGGEAQMLAMGRGLMSDARFLAIDEPSLGLAPNLVAQIFSAIKAINEDGITVLLVEQSIAQACGIAARVYLLEEGNVVLDCAACDALSDARVRTTMLGA
jgi:branched-chain amino acid transport system ATP-binding protein